MINPVVELLSGETMKKVPFIGGHEHANYYGTRFQQVYLIIGICLFMLSKGVEIRKKH